MVDCCHLEKIDKLLHFSRGSTDFYDILHIDAYWLSEPQGMFKNQLISMMVDGGHLENQKIEISPKPFGRFC